MSTYNMNFVKKKKKRYGIWYIRNWLLLLLSQSFPLFPSLHTIYNSVVYCYMHPDKLVYMENKTRIKNLLKSLKLLKLLVITDWLIKCIKKILNKEFSESNVDTVRYCYKKKSKDQQIERIDYFLLTV